jgi:hypothetical protein
MDERGSWAESEIALSVGARSRRRPVTMMVMAGFEIRTPDSWDMTEEQLRAWWAEVVADICAVAAVAPG